MSNTDAQVDEALRSLLPDGELRVFTFLFQLPDQLPFPHKSTFTIQMDALMLDRRWDRSDHLIIEDKVSPEAWSMGRAWVSLRFWQPAVRRRWFVDPEPVARVLQALVPPTGDQTDAEMPDTSHDTYVTVVEAVTQAAGAEGAASPNLLSECFTRSLAAVNQVVDAYSVAHNDPQVTRVSSQHLGLFSWVLSRRLSNTEFDAMAVYLLPYVPRVDKEPLDQTGMELLSVYIAADAAGQPFMAGERFYHQAIDAMQRGEYDSAVVLTATSGEVLLDTLLVCLLVESGEREQAEDAFAIQPGLKARVQRRYGPLLGGSWNPDSETTVVGKWWQNVESVRARILHGGYRASAQEAHEAVGIGQMLEEFVDERLGAKCTVYPRTVLSKLGVPGLEKRGRYSRKMRQLTAEFTLEASVAFWAEVGAAAAEAAARPPHRGAPPIPTRWQRSKAFFSGLLNRA